jgi:GTP pyrophosphokinase
LKIEKVSLGKQTNKTMTHKELEERYGSFFELCCGQFSDHSCTILREAIELADKALDGLTRYDGSPLLDHSVGTARIVVSEVGLGRNSAVAALLHDAARMGLISLAEVNKRFGEAPVGIILGMNDISSIRTNADKEQIDNLLASKKINQQEYNYIISAKKAV